MVAPKSSEEAARDVCGDYYRRELFKQPQYRGPLKLEWAFQEGVQWEQSRIIKEADKIVEETHEYEYEEFVKLLKKRLEIK